jgi:NADP-dependent 3-hydroxy acid dehydrogenase YdfG
MRSLHDDVIVITGAGGAIAGAVADAFREVGARPALIDRDELSITARAASYNTIAVAADMSTMAGAAAAIDQVCGRFGHVDGLVHLVGEVVSGRVQDVCDDDAYELAFDSNVRTLVNAVAAVLPGFLERDRGFIGGVASFEAWDGGAAGSALFGAAKSAVSSYLRSLDKELAGTGVNVGICFPMGYVDTPTNRRTLGRRRAHAMIDPRVIGAAFVTAASWGDGGRLVELPIYPPR